MATINLGRVKPVFRGAYAGGTAYVVDDIVTSGNETFICIQASTGNATSNASYWTKLAAKGTDGTDVGTTITTQGDILYRDGSGLQRLAAGTSGQLLQTGGSGANPSWTNAPVGGAKSFHQIDRTTHLSSGTSDTWVQILNPITMTPAGTDSKMFLHFKSILGGQNQSPGVHIKFTREISGGATTDLIGTMSKRETNNIQSIWSSGEEFFASANSYVGMPVNAMYVDQPNTTSAVTYKVFFYNGHGSSTITFGSVYSSGNNNEYPAVDTRMMLTEL